MFEYLAKQIKTSVKEIQHVTILKRSIDARQKANYWFSIESGGATVKKVTVKAIPPETE